VDSVRPHVTPSVARTPARRSTEDGSPAVCKALGRTSGLSETTGQDVVCKKVFACLFVRENDSSHLLLALKCRLPRFFVDMGVS